MTDNLASILRSSADRDPARPCLIAGPTGTTLDYGTVDRCARRFAGALRGLGVQPGEHVALLLPNVPQFTITFFGAQYAANPVVPLNVLLTPDELTYHLEDSAAAVLVVWELFAGTAAEVASRLPGLRHVVVAKADPTDLSAPAGAHNLTALVTAATPLDAPHPVRADDTAVVLYTSGTTGRPKGALLTHANLASNARVSSELVALDAGTVALVTLPLFHAFGLTVLHNAVLARGGRLVLLPRFDPATVLALMAAHRVTLFGGVPTMYVGLLAAADAAGTPSLPALRWCVSGGAPLPAPVMDAIEARFGVTLLEGYGLSETSPVVAFTVPGRPRAAGSIGYPLPGVEMRLVDGTGAVVESSGTAGEIWVRGPNVMKGYWRNAEATAESIVDGWLRTGDIAVRDPHGAYRIVDRLKDLVIRGGYNVYPREVEDVLHAHPAVGQAAVVGVPDDRYGEEVKAVVTLRPGATATPAELIAWCRTRLAAYKYPRAVEIRETLPVGPTGKVLKRELKAALCAAA